MPVDFISQEQAKRYGRYAGDPSEEQLARYFHLDDVDKKWALQCRGDHNRLGFAIQLGTVRFLGNFLSNPTDVPKTVIGYLAQQLNLPKKTVLTSYRSGQSRFDHIDKIKKEYGYQEYTSQPGHFQLIRWLYTRAWMTAERPSVLFDLATARMIEKKILLPGVSLLARLIAQIRDRASDHLWRILNLGVQPNQRKKLKTLLNTISESKQTYLDRLRRPPTHPTAKGMIHGLNRLQEIRDLGISHLNISKVPPGRVKILACYAAAASSTGHQPNA